MTKPDEIKGDNNPGYNFRPVRALTRRGFLKFIKIASLSTVFLAAGTYITQIESNYLDVTQIELTLPHLPAAFSGFRFVQISDIHMGGWMNKQRLTHIFDLIKEQNPDLVVLSGDYVQGRSVAFTSQQELDELEAALKELAIRFQTLAVLGNHEYWFNAPTIMALLQRSGVRVLINSVETISIGQESLYFAGVGDVFERQDRIQDILPELPANACAIMVAHEPDFADQSAATGRFDLQISGHSHGGQVVFPALGALVLPYLARKYPSGLYQVGNMFQYTNRGVGMTPPFIRYNCRPEITVYTLRAPQG